MPGRGGSWLARSALFSGGVTGQFIFVGFDFGGWGTRKNRTAKDAFCIHTLGSKTPVVVGEGSLFWPVDPVLRGHLSRIRKEVADGRAEVVLALDAALGWPVDFADAVAKGWMNAVLPKAQLFPTSVNNVLLFSETERFTRRVLSRWWKHTPKSAVGDRFGNNSTKAQIFALWLKNFFAKKVGVECPPFTGVTGGGPCKIIEVYPAATFYSRAAFRGGTHPFPRPFKGISGPGSSHIADAKWCAFTAGCFLKTVAASTDKNLSNYPLVFLPTDPRTIRSVDVSRIVSEGWIYFPKPG